MFSFQKETDRAVQAGASGLVHAPTGTGKTLAVWLPLISKVEQESKPAASNRRKGLRKEVVPDAHPLRVLWITPLRALSHDTVQSLRKPIRDLEFPWTVEARTGDTSSSRKSKQRERFPSCLVTTPESLSLLLSYPETRDQFATLRSVVVDEWHELLGSKRGVQTELALARLRRWLPGLQTWGLSATLGNLEEALAALLGGDPSKGPANGVVLSGKIRKQLKVETLIPKSMETFPWAGHLGLRLLPEVIEEIEKAQTTLLFTNTRSQTELWHQALLQARPDWEEEIGVHHGSIERADREVVEQRLREGNIRVVVCTSSLDLGVDFSPVDQVIQVGGPKGIARLLQRAGRSGHQPGAVSRILCVPTQAMELIEYAGVRRAMEENEIEPRTPLNRPLDVLVQHLVTCALGGGIHRTEFLEEVRSSHAYHNLTDQEYDWALHFVLHGGRSLKAYPEYARVVADGDRLTVSSNLIARFHRMQIGTITSDNNIAVRFLSGRVLGTVEESFVARMKPGTRFVFAGKTLELVRVHHMTAHVRAVKRKTRAAATWAGSRMHLSSELSAAVQRQLKEAFEGRYAGREMRTLRGLLKTQADWSSIPGPEDLLIETTETREGRHWFLFPFAGRMVHEGLGSLLAHRIGQHTPATIVVAVNDYGLELLPSTEIELDEQEWRNLLSPENLFEDMLSCLNTSELARRQFREVARVAGLVFQGYPGAQKSTRQIQASSSLFYEVFTRYEPDHLLLEQARREVLERQLDFQRTLAVMHHAQSARIVLNRTTRLTPLSFPLWAEMIRGQVSTESWSDRVQRMAGQLERESSGGVATSEIQTR